MSLSSPSLSRSPCPILRSLQVWDSMSARTPEDEAVLVMLYKPWNDAVPTLPSATTEVGGEIYGV